MSFFNKKSNNNAMESKIKGVGYKVVYKGKDGNYYPPVIANEAAESFKFGEWITANAAPIYARTVTKNRPKVKSGGKGTRGRSLGLLAFRPGFHLGDIPYAPQFYKKHKVGGKNVWPSDLVWVRCLYSMDRNYQEEAMSYGMTNNGKFRHSYAGLPYVPEGGYYRYRTNPNPETPEWIITGEIYLEGIVPLEAVNRILEEHGIEPPIVV